MKAIIWDEEKLGAEFHEEEIPDDLKETAEKYRSEMIEAAVELDDDVLATYLDGEEPDVATLKRLLRKATVNSIFYPMLCGSAFKNKGVQPLLDAVVDYLPAPSDREAYNAIDYKTGEEVLRRPLDADPLSLIAFKIMDDKYGSLTFCRIYSGKIENGMACSTRRVTNVSGLGGWC